MNNHSNYILFKNKNIRTIDLLLIVFLVLMGIISSYYSSIAPQISLVLIGAAFSTWLAFNYPGLTIFLLIFLGQIAQYELEVLWGDSTALGFGSLNLRFSDPIILGIFISLAIKAFNKDNSLSRIVFKEGKFFTFFLIYVFMEVIKNLGFYGSLAVGEFRTYYQGFIIIPFIAVSFKNSEQRYKIFMLIVGLSLFHIALGIFKGSVIQGFSLDTHDKWLSAFGSLALLYGLYAYYLLLTSKVIKPPKILVSIVFFIGLVTLIIASNRSVWLAGLVGFLFLLFIGKIKIKQQFVILIIVLFVVLIVIQLFSSEGYNFFSFITVRLDAFTNYQSDETAMWRMYAWNAIIESISKNLVWGYGLGGNFNVYVPKFAQDLGTTPHNFYLAMMYELGSVGTIFFSVFIISFVSKLRKLQALVTTDSVIKYTTYVVIVCMLSYWIAYATEKDLLTWCYLGLGFSLIINKSGKE